MSTTTPEAPKKRRWYHNLKDAYTLTKRTFGWIGWAMLGLFLGITALCVLLGWYFNMLILGIVFGLSLGMLAATWLLAGLMNKAIYAQIDGRPGAVGAVINQLKRGWIIPDQPAAFNQKQDLVWRLVGRPGIVLLSEGPTGRVRNLLREEERKARRVAPQVPIHQIMVGDGEGQVSLGQAMKELKRLKNQISKQEVPIVGQRLASLESKSLPIPKGIDPNKAKFSRRALRGK